MTTENIETKKERNCMKKENHLLENKCLSTNIVYKANISCKQLRQEEKFYLGICETSFKLRFVNHKKQKRTETNRSFFRRNIVNIGKWRKTENNVEN